MDFHKLTPYQINEFLTLNGLTMRSVRAINPATGQHYPDIYGQAEELFEQLEETGVPGFTESVVDLYLSSQVIVEPGTRYSREEIANASLEELEPYAISLNIPLDERTRERVIRILDFLEILYPLTIAQLLLKFSEAEFYYKIVLPPGTSVNPEYTLERLHSHSLFGFNGYEISMRIQKIEEDWFLILRLNPDLESFNYREELEDLSATPENLDLFFLGTTRIPIAGFPQYHDHHLRIIPEFLEEVAINLPNGQITTRRSIRYQFDQAIASDSRLAEYIEVQPIGS